jgi:hypothetical protein
VQNIPTTRSERLKKPITIKNKGVYAFQAKKSDLKLQNLLVT